MKRNAKLFGALPRFAMRKAIRHPATIAGIFVMAAIFLLFLFSGMAELESACRFSLKEILLLRMLGLGVPGFGAALALTLAVPGEGALLPIAAGGSYCLFTGLSLLCASRWRQTWACALPLVLWGGLLTLLLPANPGAGVHRSILETLLPALSMPGAMLIQCAAAGMVLFLGIRRLLGCLIARESDILSSLGGSL